MQHAAPNLVALGEVCDLEELLVGARGKNVVPEAKQMGLDGYSTRPPPGCGKYENERKMDGTQRTYDRKSAQSPR
jgi:hypothetical protein